MIIKDQMPINNNKKMLMKKIAFLFIAIACMAHLGFSQDSISRDQRMQWWREARFGMFIHWGPFSIPGSGEWVMQQRNITVKNYTNLQKFLSCCSSFNIKPMR